MKHLILFFFLILSYFPVSASEFEADYLFVDLYLDGQLFPEGAELITFDYENYFISLFSFNLIMQSDIRWSRQENKLHGSLWDAPLSYTLNFEIKENEGELLIPISDLKLLGIEPDFKEQQQLINFDTKGRHPSVEKMQREKRKEIISLMARKQANSLEVNSDYQAISVPYVDIQISGNFLDNQINHSIYSNLSQDLAWHQAKVSFNKSKGSGINGQAILERNTSNIHSYQLGDLQSLSGNLIDTQGRGLGFQFGDLSAQNNNQLKIEGFAEVGSEIELYKDKVLFDLIVVGEDGFYKFKPIETFSSKSSYYLIIQHPDGRREKKLIDSNSKLSGELGSWQSSIKFFDSSKGLIYKPYSFSQEERYFNPEIRYIWSKNSTLGLGYESSYKVNNTQKVVYSSYNYSTAPDKTSWGIKLGGSDRVFYEMKWRTPFGNNSEHLFAFISQQKYNQQSKERVHSLSYDYAIDKIQLNSSIGLTEVSDESFFSKSIGVNYYFNQMSLSANFDMIDGDYDREELYSLVSSYSSNWGRFKAIWRKASSYYSHEELSVGYSKMYEGFYLSAQQLIPLYNRKRRTSLSVSKNFSFASVALNASHSELQGLQVGLSMSFSFYGNKPLETLSSKGGRNSGSLLIKAFNDLNNDKIYSSNEPTLDDVSVTLQGSPFTELSLDNGKRLLHVPAGRKLKLEVEHYEDDNYLLKPEFGFVETTLHPGSDVTIDIPFHIEFELEGLIKAYNSKGVELSRAGRVPIELKLKYGDKINTYYTEPDGFLYFDGVKPGKYILSITKDYLLQRNLKCEPCQIEIDLNANTEQFVLLEDINLYQVN